MTITLQDMKPVTSTGTSGAPTARGVRWGWRLSPATDRIEVDDIVVEDEDDADPFHWKGTLHH